jgi:hypothetical protein
MSNIFNLGGYLKRVLSAKKGNNEDPIETKLNEKNKKENEPQEITENQLGKDRSNTDETIIEKKLEEVRAGSEEVLIEGQLNKNKSTIVKHRDESTAKGNINKIEEKRLAGDTMESEKQESASEVDKPRRFWKNKSPDGLKLANSIKIAQAIDYDIDTVDSLPDFEERLSPGALMEMDNVNRQVKQMQGDESIEESQKAIADTINDPEMLNNVFSEEVVGQDDSSGTKVEERKIIFDLKDQNNEIMQVFRKGNNINTNTLKKAIIKFINLNHIEDVIDKNSLQIDIDQANLTGSATYIVPVA